MMNQTAIMLLCTALAAGLAIPGCSSCSRNLDGASEPIAYSQVGDPDDYVPDLSSSEGEPNGWEVSSSPEMESGPESEPESEPALDLPALAMSADFLAIGKLSNEPVKWGPGTIQDELGRSTACTGLQEQYGKYNACFIGPEHEKTIALTFDQGYENGYTAPILDTLKEKGVRAVFFLTGHYVRSQPELVQRMIDEGHILGNHSDSHKIYCKDLSIEDSAADAIWMQDYLRENFGYEMRLFRFPEGEFSEQSLALMQQMGYKSLFWSFAYNDWDPKNQPDPEAARARIEKYLHPGEIMLLHSVSATNAQILPEVIDMIREEGYTIGPHSDWAV